MNGIIAWWVRNAVAANLLMTFIFVSGLIAWGTIEKEVQPIVSSAGPSVTHLARRFPQGN